MTTKDATSPKPIVILPDDPQIESFKYRIGSKFILSVDDTFLREIRDAFKDQKIILEVLSYVLTTDKKEAYELKHVNAECDDDVTHNHKWILTEQDLDEVGTYISRNLKHGRFAIIDV